MYAQAPAIAATHQQKKRCSYIIATKVKINLSRTKYIFPPATLKHFIVSLSIINPCPYTAKA
jgi:hypothetical protein